MITASAAYLAELAKSTRCPIYQIVLTRPFPWANAYWTLDETSGPRYDTMGTTTFASINSVGTVAGQVGTAAQFDSASSRYLTATTPGIGVLHNQQSFSFAAWVYLASKTANMGIAGQYGAATSARSWYLYYDQSADRFIFRIEDGLNDHITVNANTFGSPSTSTWYLVRGSYDAVNALVYISVNTGAANSAAVTGLNANAYPADLPTQPLTIGLGNTTNADYWDGRIDEARFFKRVITTQEIEDIYNKGVPLYKFCTSHPVSGEDIGDELLTDPMSLEQRVEIESGRFPTSEFKCTLTDNGGVVRAAVTNNLKDMILDFYLGFYDIPFEANKVQRFHGVITEIEARSGIYSVTSRSAISVANDTLVFDGAQTQLTAPAAAVDTALAVASTSAFATPNSDINHTYPLVMDNEFVFPRGRTSTSFTNVFRVGSNPFAIPPLVVNSQSTSHASGTAIREFTFLGQLSGSNSDSGTNDIHPIDLLQMLLGTNGEKKSLSSILVTLNTTQFTTARATLGANLKYLLLGFEPTNAKTVAEKEFYQTLAAYPRENNQGQLGIKLYQAAAVATAVDTITDADIVEDPHWLRNAEKCVNIVIVYYDENPITRQYSSFEYRDETLLAIQQRELPLTLYSKGIRGAYAQTVPVALSWFGTTAAFLTSMAQRQIARFGNNSPVFSCKTVFTKQLLECGDDISVSFTNVLDIDTGVASVSNKKGEIQFIRHDFGSNLIEFEILSYPE